MNLDSHFILLLQTNLSDLKAQFKVLVWSCSDLNDLGPGWISWWLSHVIWTNWNSQFLFWEPASAASTIEGMMYSNWTWALSKSWRMFWGVVHLAPALPLGCQRKLFCFSGWMELVIKYHGKEHKWLIILWRMGTHSGLLFWFTFNC